MLGNFKGYTVSSNGTVYSKKDKEEMRTRVRKGYREVYLYIDGKYQWVLMHRLVAMVFLPNPYNKPEVHHIDENKLNNDVNNLMWVTKSENKGESWRKVGYWEVPGLFRNTAHYQTEIKDLKVSIDKGISPNLLRNMMQSMVLQRLTLRV